MELWSVAQWAREMGGNHNEWKSKVDDLGIQPRGKGTGRQAGTDLYRVKDLITVIAGGDLEAEQLGKLKAERIRIELQNAETRRELVSVSAVRALGEKVMVALRARLQAMPFTDEQRDKMLRELAAMETIDWTSS